ncbi:MAG TPA: hypothetical protein VMV50_01395 [Candidatus Paceibacterota bacterium]|nr:hypothetical protein [Candidatus Paceibacterota bacterium]
MTPDHPHTPDPFAKRILERIKGERLVPRPRWEFVFKNYFFWTLGAIAVILGAIAFSAALFQVENAGWRLSVVTHESFLSFVLDTAPFLWACALILFILIGYVNVRRTNHGYRYPLLLIALGAVLTSVTLGTAFYATGFGGEIEEALGGHLPFYRPILVEERSWWVAPEKGLLGGRVLSVTPGVASFMLQDFDGRTWEVDGSDLRGPDLTIVARGGEVRVVGVPATTTAAVFHACFVFPWQTYGLVENGPLPVPLAFFSTTSERIATTTRSELCRGIRPYQELRTLDENGI